MKNELRCETCGIKNVCTYECVALNEIAEDECEVCDTDKEYQSDKPGFLELHRHADDDKYWYYDGMVFELVRL